MTELFFIGSLLASLLLGQFGRIELFGKQVNGYIQDPVAFIFVVYLFIRYGNLPLRKAIKNNYARFLSGCVLFSYLQTFGDYSLVNNAIALLYSFRIFLYIILGIYLNYLYQKKKHILPKINVLISFFSIFLILASIIQYIFFSNFWGLYAYGWDPHMFRMSATFIDVYIAAALYGMFALYWYQRGKPGLALVFVACLVFTFSRSSYLAFLLSGMVFLITSGKWKQLLMVIFLFILLVIIVPKPFGEGVSLLRTTSVNSRIKDYQVGISMALKKPLFGYGYNRIRFGKESLNLVKADDRSHSVSSFHSSFLIILVTIGMVGLIAFLLSLLKFGMTHKTLVPILFYLCVMSLFDNVLLHVFIILPLVIIGSEGDQSSLE